LMPAIVVAGDVGGTKTHLGLYQLADNKLSSIRDHTYVTRDFPNLEATLTDFLAGAGRVNAACFGVPGPVIDRVSHATNVPWDMREQAIAASLGGAATRLVNDLEATSYGLLQLEDSQFAVLQRGESHRTAASIAVIAAGTGLGEGALVATGDSWHSIASEGGHADFAPRGKTQVELLEFLTREFDHVSFERVLSGPGLHNIYRFLAAASPNKEPEWLVERMRTEDASAVISEAALSGKDATCKRALEMFVEIYGAEAANLALKFLAMGGVYLGGGIAPKILPMLEQDKFMRAFLNKGRLKSTLERIPVRVSLNPAAALVGAAHIARTML
jgi:glucokinase